MDLYVRVAEPDVDAMIDLQHWLAHDDRFPAPARQAQTEPTRPARPGGAMGTTTDVLQLVVGNAIALSQLLLSIAQWRRSRPQPPVVRVSVHRPDGVTVSIESDDPEAIAAVVRELGEP
jgi:Effector Associated Constant Component 1